MQNNLFGRCYRRDNHSNYYDTKTDKAINKNETDTLHAIKKVKIPKTYTDAVICPDDRNDLMGTAVDGKGQLQYFYSDKHKANATRSKNCNLIHFGNSYADIIDDVQRILGSSDADPALVLHALALRIMTLCHFRPGATHNVRENGTFGLTTMQWDHYAESGTNNVVKISFKGKKNQTNTCVIQDPVTVNLLKQLNNNRNANNLLLSSGGHDAIIVTPKSLNEFLHNYHPSICTKTWRTWFANMNYIEKISDLGVIPDTQRERKILSNRIIRTIAEELHHTLAVNKRNYLIPELEEMFIKNPDNWFDMVIKTSNPRDFLLTFLKGYCTE